jgi:uncharacterized integral membrane protein
MSTTDPKPATPATPAEQGRSAPAPGAPATDRAPESHGPGVVRRTTNTVKRIFLFALGALVALFAVFNSQNVEVRWIFGDPIQTPLILAIAVTFVAGAIIGWLVAKLGTRGAAPKA